MTRAWRQAVNPADRFIVVPDIFGGPDDRLTYQTAHQADFDAARAAWVAGGIAWLGISRAAYMDAGRRQAWLCGWESKAVEARRQVKAQRVQRYQDQQAAEEQPHSPVRISLTKAQAAAVDWALEPMAEFWGEDNARANRVPFPVLLPALVGRQLQANRVHPAVWDDLRYRITEHLADVQADADLGNVAGENAWLKISAAVLVTS